MSNCELTNQQISSMLYSYYEDFKRYYKQNNSAACDYILTRYYDLFNKLEFDCYNQDVCPLCSSTNIDKFGGEVFRVYDSEVDGYVCTCLCNECNTTWKQYYSLSFSHSNDVKTSLPKINYKSLNEESK